MIIQADNKHLKWGFSIIILQGNIQNQREILIYTYLLEPTYSYEVNHSQI